MNPLPRLTRRQKLMDGIKSRLSAIELTNGRVLEWRDQSAEAIQPEEMPCILYRDTSEQVTHTSATYHDFILSVEITVVCAEDSDTAPFLRELLGEIQLAIREDTSFGGIAYFCQPVSTDFDVQTLGKRAGVATLRMDVRYRTDVFNPYELN